mmetsp:Transcript_13902/g.32285  ORF Transcript_13902/g.32285 Transcript_13902/m.32285 type:complete len:321 (-) Transcript_13902:3808-4770(-)
MVHLAWVSSRTVRDSVGGSLPPVSAGTCHTNILDLVAWFPVQQAITRPSGSAATDGTVVAGSVRVASSSPVARPHTRTVPSLAPLTTLSPRTAIAMTVLVWPRSASCSWLVAREETLTVRSSPPDTSRVPSGVMVTAVTASPYPWTLCPLTLTDSLTTSAASWPPKFARHLPVSAHRMRARSTVLFADTDPVMDMVRLSEPVAIVLPSGERHTATTLSSCGWMGLTAWVGSSHFFAVRSADPVMRQPSGVLSSANTWRPWEYFATLDPSARLENTTAASSPPEAIRPPGSETTPRTSAVCAWIARRHSPVSKACTRMVPL